MFDIEKINLLSYIKLKVQGWVLYTQRYVKVQSNIAWWKVGSHHLPVNPQQHQGPAYDTKMKKDLVDSLPIAYFDLMLQQQT